MIALCRGRWGLFFALVFPWFVAGCLDRPLVEASPNTVNQYVGRVVGAAVTKIDLLFMVDNSASMSDKQQILQAAVPVLLTRLISPTCIDPQSGAPTGENALGGRCQHGEPEFTPVADIHVGIVTSSLGGHGSNAQCGPLDAHGRPVSEQGFTPNDQAHLLGTLRPSGSNADPQRVFDISRTWNRSGFLAWDANQTDQPVPGTADVNKLQGDFQDMIMAAGEQGCGFEASLESWYRFLVDPEPPKNVTMTSGMSPETQRGSARVTHGDGSSSCEGCDLELLAQRKAFLRPDSLLAIVMLSDENDCSIRDESIGWAVVGAQQMPRATSACALNPNDPCCRSCIDPAAPASGCMPTADDAQCKQGKWDAPNDTLALRCYHQQQRFGFDLLYPTARYVEALTSPTLTLQSDHKTKVQNPLFAPGATTGARDPSLIFLAGIVGVPWQDIADDASLTGPGLKYLTAKELFDRNRWSLLLGKPDANPPLPPTDPFMVETPAERRGENPITHDAIAPANSMNPEANRINGHEQHVPKLDDLQYACTFPLAQPKLCQGSQQSCDCSADPIDGVADVTARNRPLCQPPAGGPAGMTQYYAKAYPGSRELQVLKDLKDQGIVASICPKQTSSADRSHDPNYGYNPAVDAIIERLKTQLAGKCLPRPIESDPQTHQVRCKVIEAQPAPGDCSRAGRMKADASVAPWVQRELEATGHCGGEGQVPCASYTLCEIQQEAGAELEACRQGQATKPGYCYVDDPASPLLRRCASTEKRLVHFVSGPNPDDVIPAPGAVAVVACLGAPL